MALITSAASGNFSEGATWTGGVVPGVGDEARASNGHTITIDVDTTCDEVSNAGTGIFTLADGVTLTANVTSKSTTTSRACLQFTAASPAIGYVVGNCTGGTVNSAWAVSNTGTGTLEVTGDAVAGSAANTYGANNSGSGVLSITGVVTGGAGTNSFGVFNSSGTANITGNVNGGATGGGANSGPAGGAGGSATTMNITGTVTGGSGSVGVRLNNVGTCTITGAVIANSATGAHGAINTTTGTLIATRAVGNSYGIGAAGGVGLAYGLNSADIGSDSRAEELEYGENGAAPTFGAVKIIGGTNNKALVALTTSAVKTLADPSDASGMPDEADVRSGLSYALGNKTGTCAVPPAASVGVGVPIDATTGTAALTPAAVWDALTSGMTTSGSIGARLKNAATLDSTGQQLADALSPVP